MLAEVKVGSLVVVSDPNNPNKTQGKSHEMNQKMNRNECEQKPGGISLMLEAEEMFVSTSFSSLVLTSSEWVVSIFVCSDCILF